MSEIHNPHDKLFKETFSHKDVVVDFVKNYLPEELLDIIDVTTIELQKESFIQKELQDYHSDLLFSVAINEQKGYLYFLFEHKSYLEKAIAIQLLQYIVSIWQHEMEKKNFEQLPVIIPIVLYHGKAKWTKPKTIFELLEGNERVKQKLSEFIPNFAILCYNFSEYSDIEIKGATKLRTYLQLIRHLYSDDLDLLYSIVVQLDQTVDLSYFETVII